MTSCTFPALTHSSSVEPSIHSGDQIHPCLLCCYHPGAVTPPISRHDGVRIRAVHVCIHFSNVLRANPSSELRLDSPPRFSNMERLLPLESARLETQIRRHSLFILHIGQSCFSTVSTLAHVLRLLTANVKYLSMASSENADRIVTRLFV